MLTRSHKLTTQPPLRTLVRQVRWRFGVPVEVLEQCDAVLNACRVLSGIGSIDALPMSRTLLAVLLRLSWVSETGKQNSRVDPKDVPLKLYNHQRLTKRSLDELIKASKSDDPQVLIDCSCSLLVWLARAGGAK